jgi:hypothetical protein
LLHVVPLFVKNKNSFAHALDRALYILYNIIAKKAMEFANYTAIFFLEIVGDYKKGTL